MEKSKRVLFMCETVTLAHIVRSLSLATSLKDEGYEIYFAAREVPVTVEEQMQGMHRLPLESSVSSADFLKSLSHGKIPYDVKTIEKQVDEDLTLLSRLQPCLVVGDFRNSLLISAKLAGVQYLNITNLTWNRTAQLPLQIPDLPLVHIFGEMISKTLFSIVRPFVFRSLARPFNTVAKNRGLKKGLGSLLDIYCGGDVVFYADDARLVKTETLPSHHHVGGHIAGHLNLNPSDLKDLEGTEPLIVVSLGSSGPQELLPQILQGLSRLPVRVLVSTAGKKLSLPSYENVQLMDFVPVDLLMKQASALICNGGSPSSYAAAGEGVPFLSIPINLDQFNTSQAFVSRGVSLRLRREQVTPESICTAVNRLLTDKKIHLALREMKAELAANDAQKYFRELVGNLTQE
jgi:UDP:flavonoid glycosyltransferase YjiC (YdhE family)